MLINTVCPGWIISDNYTKPGNMVFTVHPMHTAHGFDSCRYNILPLLAPSVIIEIHNLEPATPTTMHQICIEGQDKQCACVDSNFPM